MTTISMQIAHWHTRLEHWSSQLLDLVYPPRCPGCQIRLTPELAATHDGWCEPCRGTVFELERPRCTVCATPRPTQIGEVYRGIDTACAACTDRRPAFDRTESLFEYTGALADALQYTKYARSHWPLPVLGRAFGPFLLDVVASLDDPVLATVPMHRRDLVRRGFHPMEMLMHRLARRHPSLATARVIEKSKYTPPQAGLTLGERLGNVRGAFDAVDSVDVGGRPVLLIDDVMTTGATADAAARALLGAGAGTVTVATLARAVTR